MLKFEEELKNALENFQVDNATSLSIKIQKAGDKGYKLSEQEELLWGKLTILIFRDRGEDMEQVDWSCVGCN